jgi:DNA-binding MarR family transcriptional regulator
VGRRCGYVELRAARDDARATTVHSTARGRRLLTTVFELVDEIERDFAAALEPGRYDTVRDGLLRIADKVDPGGALGIGDRP